MTMFGVSRAEVKFGSFLGLKLTKEQVLDCREVEPGDYKLAHGYVEMDIAIGHDDSVSVAVDSLMSGLTVRSIKFGGSTLELPVMQNTNSTLSVIPKFAEAALVVGPDKKGLTFSLERHASKPVAPVAIGTLAIETALKPRVSRKINKPIIFGGAGSG